MLENLGKVSSGSGQFTENVVGVSAPVEAALRASFLSLEVRANGDEVVRLNTIDLSPEFVTLELHRLLQNVECKFDL